MILKLIRSIFLKKKLKSLEIRIAELKAQIAANEVQIAANEVIKTSYETEIHRKKADEIMSSLQLSGAH